MRKTRKWATKITRLLSVISEFAGNDGVTWAMLEKGMEPQARPLSNRPEIIARVVAAYKKAKSHQETVSEAYKGGGEWENIEKSRTVLLECVNGNNNAGLEDLLSNLFRNMLSRGMFPSYENFSKRNKFQKMVFLNEFSHDLETWRQLLGEKEARIEDVVYPDIGNPWGVKFGEGLIPYGVFRHHYYSKLFSELLGDIARPVVAEIGCGYGAFARYLLKEKKELAYIGFDLPEIVLVLSYFLLNCFPDKKFILFGEKEGENISMTDIEKNDLILMPISALPSLAGNSVDLFLNTRSFSEMDYVQVETYLNEISRVCRGYFFHENSASPISKGEHFEVVASEFPVDMKTFKLLYHSISPWVVGGGRYQEFLYGSRREDG
ncbi:MAG: putative sugar O-methyltransferase [bacterium]|nr:putative sugar O-methyltransferase [bacterium]